MCVFCIVMLFCRRFLSKTLAPRTGHELVVHGITTFDFPSWVAMRLLTLSFRDKNDKTLKGIIGGGAHGL